MNNLTIAQKIYLAVLLTFAGLWLGLQVGLPIYEYSHGKSALTALLASLSTIFLAAVFAIVVLGWVLQGMGILPATRRDPQPDAPFGWSMSPVGRLRNLAIWIVIALVLVFLFNFFQSGGPHKMQSPDLAQVQTPDLMGIFINWFPMLLIFGVWVFFLRKMRPGQGKDTDKRNDP
ncbi:MAG TPA: hypothetical protein VFI23_01250 [Rhizomicrobium sp.]|nr:hypothetical protein [Rhizomicrobium sp.]